MKEEEKLYHIYAKGRCIYYNLSEEKFSETWELLHKMVDLIDTSLRKEDFQYEEVTVNKKVLQNSSY